MAIPPNAQQILDENNDSLNNIVDNSLGVMPEGLSPEEQEEFRARQLAQMQSGQQQMQTLFQANTEINDATEDAMNKLPAAAGSYFDLTKEAQMEMGQPVMDQGIGEFDSHIDLFQYLEQKLASGQPEAIDEVRNELFQIVGNQPTVDEQGIEQPNPRQVIADSLQEYLRALQEGNEQKRAKLAMTMFEAMPQSDQGDTMVQGVKEVVAESNETIRRLAKSLASRQMNKQASSSKAFNLKKEAQHKGMDNVIMHGPEGNRIDPFTGQLINDWHVYERNKGWGLKMDDALFIDYEALWRGHIMDKYSRPYRDEDGNYVGGYIEKRFEVDKWIPPGNNYQLKPGEKRRPYLPEYRSTEARMQHMRANNTDEGRVYNDTTEPFNWSKMASSKKQTKTAQFDQPQGMTFIVQDLQTGQELQRLSAPGKDEALQQAQAMARQRSQPVLLLTYDMAADEMDPIEEDMIWPDEAAQPVAASADSKKKVN
tara:strand:+ start:33390 stop:34835 length:1446 start_codon:yes stop_codon:yes gene_type:complete